MSFIRKYKVDIDGTTIESSGIHPLQVSFDCGSNITAQQDEFTVTILNLSPSTIANIKKEYQKITLYAGYEDGDFGMIAKGEIRSVESQRDKVNIKTVIHAGSGDEGCQKGVVNKTMKKNATVKDCIKECHKKMKNVKCGRAKGVDMKADKTHMTLLGSSKRCLNKLAKRANFDWFIEMQEMKALNKKQTFDNVHEVSVDTGMVGSPKKTEKGAVVECLLNSGVRVGEKVKIVSRDLSREFKIVSYKHQGDYYGSSSTWKTIITGENLK